MLHTFSFFQCFALLLKSWLGLGAECFNRGLAQGLACRKESVYRAKILQFAEMDDLTYTVK